MTQVLLAIDTSQGTAVALLVDGEIVSDLYEPNTMRHAEQIGALISKALTQSGKKASEVTAVSVGLGPAPFTGLRVGIAAAKLFAEGASVPIFGVGSLDAIAFSLDLAKPLLVITDARRSEVYFGLYQGKGKSGAPVLLKGPGVKKLAELESELQASGQAYEKIEGVVRASNVGLLTLAQLAEGSASTTISANYLRAPDAVATQAKKVSG